MPHGFNIYNEKWRFHMQPAGNPFELTMPMAVRALQFYRELVEKYGMADMAFALGTAEAGSETVVVKAYYWVTEIDGQPTLPPTTSGNTTTTTTTTNNNNSSLSNHPKWPPAPLMFSIPNTHPQAQLTFIRVDCEHPQTPADTAWLLGAIYHQLSVYGQERHPQGFNFFTERLRFYMQMGEPAMDMGLAVMAMEVFRGLVETWGVATVVFYVQVEHEYRGYYWVFNRDEDAVAEA